MLRCDDCHRIGVFHRIRTHPECPDSDPPDRSIAADILLREEPDGDEEEEEEDGERKEDGDDENEEEDDGYSE
jgi:hypothetical protein